VSERLNEHAEALSNWQGSVNLTHQGGLSDEQEQRQVDQAKLAEIQEAAVIKTTLALLRALHVSCVVGLVLQRALGSRIISS